jgi:hypothetical protein
MNKKLQIVLHAFFAFSAAALVAYATDWSDPITTPPSQSIAAPLSPTNVGQVKFGGLQLNTELGDAIGLAILGGNGKGFVGIGTTNPTEKLDVTGNILVAGYLNFSGGPGDPYEEQIVGITPDGKTNWTDRYAWITLLGQPGTGGPYCGNGYCSNGETCSTCSVDCGICGGPPPPPPGESCGNGSCGTTESCSTCPFDCGICGPGGGGTNPAICGNLILEGTEECDPPGSFGTFEFLCPDGISVVLAENICTSACTLDTIYPNCPSTPPPPPPPAATCGNTPQCGGTCEPIEGKNGKLHEASCYDTGSFPGSEQQFPSGCFCSPDGPEVEEGSSDAGSKNGNVAALPILSTFIPPASAQGAPLCTGSHPQPCPFGWQQYGNLTCEEVGSAALWARQCYRDK